MKPKSGGSALKKLKQTIVQAKIPEKIQKVGKRKSKKSQQSQVVQRREARQELRTLQQKTQQNNPFEQRFAKQKHVVLNRNVKGIQGKPGQVRARAQEIRKNTLGVELKTKNRENVIIDKRIGENDASMSVEDKMLMRMMREKTRKTNGAMFNLQEEEELTHMGQSLSASGFGEAGLVPVERDDDSDRGEIEADMVRFGHFGGFEEDEEKTGKKSRNEIMKELIAKSKSHKRERQMIKEQNMDLQEEVDADLDEIRGLLVPMHAPSTEGRMVVNADRLKMISGEIERPSEQPLPPKEEEDDYDRAVKELAFDKRARPSNRTKTEEELALEAKKELEELEAKRVRRMKGIVSDDDEPETTKKRKRDSRNSQADDLGDNDYTEHWQQTVEDEEEMPLTYKDGKLVNNKIFMKPAAGESDSEEYGSEEESDSDSGSGSGSEEESGDESSSDKESAEKTKSKVAKKEYDVEDLGGNVALDSDQGSESSGSDSDDSDDSRDSEQRMLEEMATDSESEAEVEKPAKKKKKIVQEASASLPFTFEFPNNYEEFMDLIKDQSTENQLTIVKRLRILYSVKLAKENKEKMNRLMVILLKHTMDLSNSGSMDLEVIKGFTEHVIELCRQSPHAFAAWCQSRILFLRDRLNKNLLSGKKKTSLFPSPGDLLLFKNLARIYSVSDLQHPVMTPVMLLLAQYLEQAPINVDLDVMSGLFICRIYYQYVEQSKRYVPEVINFLYSVLVKLVPSTATVPYLPDSRQFKLKIQIKDFKVDNSELRFETIFGKDFVMKDQDRLSVLTEIITLFEQYCRLYAHITTIIEVFEPFRAILATIPTGNSAVQNAVAEAKRVVFALLESAHMRRRPLMLQKRKAMAIKTYVPKFQTTYSIDRNNDPDRDRARQSKETSEYKRELKGAIRELRKDAAFIGREKLEIMKQKDAQYKKKMDKIVGQLAEQEGAMRGYEKEKGKGRKRK